jgi:hypothetical protein
MRFLPHSSLLCGSFGLFTNVQRSAGSILAKVIVEGIISLCFFLYVHSSALYRLQVLPVFTSRISVARGFFILVRFGSYHMRQSVNDKRVPLSFEWHSSRANLVSACATVVLSLSLQDLLSFRPRKAPYPGSSLSQIIHSALVTAALCKPSLIT